MKKPLLKLTSTILSASMLLSSVALFSTNAEETATKTEAKTSSFFDKLPKFRTGDNSLKEERPDDIKVISSVEDYYNTAISNGEIICLLGSNSVKYCPSKMFQSP